MSHDQDNNAVQQDPDPEVVPIGHDIRKAYHPTVTSDARLGRDT
ncbi:MAG: hypothetical protein ABIG63_05680 [Chloroflexota bacterium]